MSASRAVDASILAIGVAVAGVGVLVDDSAGAWDLLFGTVMVASALTVLRLAVRASRRTRAERAIDRRLAATSAERAAQLAAVAERVRLAADTEAVVRAAVTDMGARAEAAERDWDRDPVPALREVQQEGVRATAELRRLLGLLREASREDPAVARSVPTRAIRFGLSDLAVAVGLVLLAVVERSLEGEPALPGMDTSTSLLFTGLAAATILGRRVAPAPAAAMGGLLFLLAAAVGRPITPGFWVLGLATLAWSAAARRTLLDTAGTVTLLAGVTVGMAWRDPENLQVSVLILGFAGAGGAAVGWLDARGNAARERAGQRAAALADAAEDAVRAERVAVARDLHDVVSHAVGVMVLQAGAAEALRAGDPTRARAALGVVRRTAVEALAELDRLVAAIRDGAVGARPVTAGAVSHDVADLQALVRRMRTGGLVIGLSVDGDLAGDTAGAVYRIVQESLTNAARHAPGARVVVTVSAGPQGATVEVADDGPGQCGGSGRGYGLVGIAERVHALGGELTTGTRTDGAGFRVHADLPARSPAGRT